MNRLINQRGVKYLSSFLVLFFILISMTLEPVITDILGNEILIKTQPVDPRDLFRGDYVQLNYEINDIKLEQLDEEIVSLGNTDLESSFEELKGKKLYVSLRENGKFYDVYKVTLQKPKEGIFIRGKYKHPIWGNKDKPRINGIRVDYTLDKFFVPENTGKQLEERARNGEVFAKIKVYKGYSLLKEVLD